MAKRKRNDLSNGKKQIIAGLLSEYDIRTAEDIKDALKDLLGGELLKKISWKLKWMNI